MLSIKYRQFDWENVDNKEHGCKALIANAQEEKAVHVHHALLVVVESEVDKTE
jgi:hypothetical protein